MSFVGGQDSITCGGRTRFGTPASSPVIYFANSSGTNYITMWRNNSGSWSQASAPASLTCWCLKSNGTNGSASYLNIGYGDTSTTTSAPTNSVTFFNGDSTLGLTSSVGIDGQNTNVHKETLIEYVVPSGKFPYLKQSTAVQVSVEMLCY